jgi:hypothetical protein
VDPRIDPSLKDNLMDVGNLAIAQEDIFRVVPMKQLIPTFADDLRG